MRAIGGRLGVLAAVLVVLVGGGEAGAAALYRAGTYEGRTSQGLSIWFTVDATSVEGISFEWRARCADGQVHRNGISLGDGSIRDGRFDVYGLLVTGGRARVVGRLAGSQAGGKLSRWANSAFGTVCVARGVRWHAHLTQGTAPLV